MTFTFGIDVLPVSRFQRLVYFYGEGLMLYGGQLTDKRPIFAKFAEIPRFLPILKAQIVMIFTNIRPFGENSTSFGHFEAKTANLQRILIKIF